MSYSAYVILIGRKLSNSNKLQIVMYLTSGLVLIAYSVECYIYIIRAYFV